MFDDDLHALGEAWGLGGLGWGGGGLDGFDGGLDGAAFGVSHDDDESWSELEGGELDGSELEGGDDVSGDADDEHVSDALVEDDFGGDAGVGASDDDGEGVLVWEELVGAVDVGGLACDESLVPFDEFLECVRWICHGF